jgi:hypothetical protein
MNPNVLTCYASPYPKLRIGRDHDGGYIIADLPDAPYRTLIAGGIGKDIAFEEDLCKLYPNATCYACDGTIKRLPKHDSDIQFINKNVAGVNTDSCTNLHDIIDATDHVFAKMDIEGGEIPWVLSLKNEHLDKFEQIVMEFHDPFVSYRRDSANEVFGKLNKTHCLIHLHPNNCRATVPYMGVQVPVIFQCTYLHKRHFTTQPALNTDPIPGPLDMRNLRRKGEVVLTGPPFVHRSDP